MVVRVSLSRDTSVDRHVRDATAARAVTANLSYVLCFVLPIGDLRARIHPCVYDKRLPAKDLFRYSTRRRARGTSIEDRLLILVSPRVFVVFLV